MENFKKSILELIIETSTNLPPDVRKAIAKAQEMEDKGTQAALALQTIAINVDMAADESGAICQDTGMPTFEIKTPAGANQLLMKEQIKEAIAEATKLGKLRPNSVDSLTGKNSGNNLGPGTPVIHFDQWESNDVEIRLILKGGGCENKNIQYSVPADLGDLGRADRNLEGIRKCIMHAVYQAQGQGCSAGAIGVCIGGDRASSYLHAKAQLFRKLDDVNPIPELQKLEEYVMEHANMLGIGAMGFGGKATLIGCKIGVLNRLPASFFVSVAYNCWAFRRQGVIIDSKTGDIKNWIYRDKEPSKHMSEESEIKLTGNEVVLTTPFTEEQVRALKVGDVVLINGKMHTGRDALHHYLLHNDSPVDLNGAVIYHCGPVCLKEGDKWFMGAAGPTTSIREEPFQADVIKKFGIRGIIGKGGMGAKTLAALKEQGAVYLNAIGGAAQFYSKCIKEVEGVDFLEFGIPEAMWHIRVEGFPAIVTMDAHGNSLHADVEKSSKEELAKHKEPVF
ncbi:MAG: fumarate hydratase [Ignavibacteriae bacterium]|nr:MAG: fumarate hydratase [Ignavibacteriota bacterium]